MGLILIGISHKTASVKIRERFSLTSKQIRETLLNLKKIDLILGVVILSTCNRMELYTHVVDNSYGIEKIKKFLLEYFKIKEDEINHYFYILEDMDVANHIFRVTPGLDSQILGEIQILGQVKFAWTIAKDVGVISDFLDELFKKAINIGRVVRLRTKISQGNISIGSIAIKICEDYFGNLQNKKVLIIGAGEISTLVSKYLKEKGARGIFVSNRTYAKAYELALDCQGEAITFCYLKEKLKIVDIVISSTSSPHLILKKEDFTDTKKPLLVIDLSIPRDVDAEVRYLEGISYFCLDDLDFIVERNLAQRKQEIPKVLKVIEEEIKNLCLIKRLEQECEPIFHVADIKR